ncbi:MAG TPA: hypothetical protein VJC16_00020 [Candidatus Nanoarchaeia archaeon]|nr:hypothetical protein [Candidatus Nanoarchaeia archaeon]
MNTHLDDAREELKRADHLIYVSLKYTRTVDVIKNIIERLISAFDFGFQALLEHQRRKRKNKDIPKTPSLRAEALREGADTELVEYINFYLLLRKVSRASFTRSREFRRHVKMTAILENDVVIDITIDTITEYYHRVKKFAEYVQQHAT